MQGSQLPATPGANVFSHPSAQMGIYRMAARQAVEATTDLQDQLSALASIVDNMSDSISSGVSKMARVVESCARYREFHRICTEALDLDDLDAMIRKRDELTLAFKRLSTASS